MLPAPASPQVAAASGLLVALLFLTVGYLVVDGFTAARSLPVVTRLGLAFPGALAMVLILLGLHVATGGRVFSEPWVTRGLVAAVAVGALACTLVRGRRAVEPEGAGPLITVAVAVAAAVILWGFPTLRLLPLDHAWDSDFHAGLANELINGETLPHGTVTGSLPNDYPWMFHSVLATTASFMPGGRAQDAFDSAFFLQVLGGVVTLVALGWELTRRWYGGAAGALFGGLSGGFGYLVHNGAAVVIDPRAHGGAAAVRRWGDMLFVRSYSMSFNNLAPTFPRDIGFALLSAFLLLTIIGFRRRSLLALSGAGLVLGMIGLSTGESMFAGLGTAGLLVLLPPISRARKSTAATLAGPTGPKAPQARHSRWAIGAALLIPSLGLWSLWLGPLIYNLFTLGGITGSANSPVILPAAAFLGAWGLAAAFAVAGLIAWLPVVRDDVGARVVLSLMVVVAALLALTHVVPLLLSKGFSTLGREHRYWPLMYLPVALLAAVGATRIVEWVLRRSRIVAIGLGAAVIALCVPSPLLASAALPTAKPDPQEVTRALTGERSMLSLMSPAPGERCVVATTPDWSHQVFAFSGYRLILYRWTKKVWANSAHIRFIGIYDRIPTTKQRVAALNVLLAPQGRKRWEAVARHWKVNVVTVPEASLPAWMSKNYRVEKTRYKGRPVSVVRVSPCA